MIIIYKQLIFRGVSSIIGPPIAGAVYESTESYNISFFLAGGFLLIAAIFSVIADIVRRTEDKENKT